MNKQDYEYYLEADRLALGRLKKYSLRDKLIRTFIAPDHVWNYEKHLRKTEYLLNCRIDIMGRFLCALALMRLDYLSTKYGFHVNPNNFGAGLSISYTGSIIINGAARIGTNCRIHTGVVIGTQAGYSDRAPKLGNNIYIGPGAKIYGPIEIADNIAIGANSVVNRSFKEPGITIAGIPARKIGDKGSFGLLIRATDILNK